MMDAVADFEDLLELFEKHRVHYLIVGGLAFIYHAKPRYTKDMDLWVGPDPENVERANVALVEFGSPFVMDPEDRDEIVQLGAAPNRIDLLRNPASAGGPRFEQAWPLRVRGRYGQANANWVDFESLLEIKSQIDHPRHQEDARVLRQVKEMRAAKGQ